MGKTWLSHSVYSQTWIYEEEKGARYDSSYIVPLIVVAHLQSEYGAI